MYDILDYKVIYPKYALFVSKENATGQYCARITCDVLLDLHIAPFNNCKPLPLSQSLKNVTLITIDM